VLAAGDSLDENIGIELPPWASGPYYVIVLIDSHGQVYEAGADNDNSLLAVTNVFLPPPADLVVTGISVPVAAEPGEPVMIEWTVENIGSNPAVGQMRDGIYVSADSTFDPGAPLVGIATRTVNIPPGGQLSVRELVTLSAETIAALTGSLTSPLPGVSPGSYYAHVKTNMRNNIREVSLDNNAERSASTMIVDMQSLVLDVAASGTLTNGQSRYYKLDVPAGFDLRLDLTSNEPAATNELFVAFGRAPTPGDFDFTGPAEFTSKPGILVPSSQAGTYYILVRAATLPVGVTTETYNLKARALPFSITAVTPPFAGSPGQVTLTLDGAGFRETTEVFLSLGGSRIAATKVLFQNTTRLRARFQLPPGLSGTFSVVATNVDENSVERANAVVVEPARPMAITVTPVRPDVIRNNASGYFTFRYRNASNVDIPHLEARLLLPGTARVAALSSSSGFLKSSDRHPGLDLISGNVTMLQNPAMNDSVQAMDFEAANLAPDAEVTVTVNIKNFPTSPFSLRSMVELSDNPTWLARQAATIELARQAILGQPSGFASDVLTLAADPDLFRSTALQNDHVLNGLVDVEDVALLSLASSGIDGEPGGLIPGFDPPLDAEDDSCASAPQSPDCTVHTALTVSALPRCRACFDGTVPRPFRLSERVIVRIPENTCDRYRFDESIDATVVAPCDPNTLTGPPGYGAQKWVGLTQPMLFTTNFENLAGVATAPAQVVTLRVPLHSNLDLSSFRLGSFGFGSHVIEVPPNRSSYTVEPYFSDLNLRVRITAGVDVNARQAFWTFTSIDPNTGQVPTNPQVGFLPVNDPFGRGQGYANFTVRPLGTATTGAGIVMQSSVTFDTNAPLLTNTTSNTVDAGKPTSSANSSPQIVNPTTIRVNWTGGDGPTGSGVGVYNLYMQQDNGGFQQVVQGAAGTTATLTVGTGHSYGFYTQAVDNSGNTENLKTAAEAVVNLASQTGVGETPIPPEFALLQNYPNPFRSATTVQFDLPYESAVDMLIFDVSGRLVMQYLDGRRFPAGRHVLHLDASFLGTGIYFYQLKTEGNTFTKKMLVVR
jgi:hypothetical protein